VREQATAKLDDVQRKIRRLQDIGAALERLIATCPGRGGLQACSIMDALTHHPGGRLGNAARRLNPTRAMKENHG
jgi:MerR family transcriptional regulator, copper efflux regulator